MVELQNVCKRYGAKAPFAVENLSITLEPGEIFGFIGSNGAGKTTTIKMMTGILRPDQGSISIFGHDIENDSMEAKRNFGYVNDNHEIYERLKGIEYLNFLGDVYNVPINERKKRVDELLHIFELEEAINDQVKSYSHGMKQKLCIIGSLISDPNLWILDEPMTGLDPQASYRLKKIMKDRCEEGKIVFFSTHVLEVAQKLCDRVGIIKKGQLLFVGTLDELMAQEGTTEDSLEELYLSLIGEAE